jgi:hypothetical protein
VRIEAAAALASHGQTEESLPVLAEALTAGKPDVALHAARALELLGERARPVLPTMEAVLQRVRTTKSGDEMQMFIRFSLEAAAEARAGTSG